MQISNLPVQMNVKAQELRDYLEDQLVVYDLIDEENKKIITGLDIDESKAAGVLVMKSVEDAKRIQLLDGLRLLGHTLRISQYSETETGGYSQAILNNPKLSAQAAAVAYMAFESVTKKDKQALDLDKQRSEVVSTKFIKVMNLADPDKSQRFKDKKFEEIAEDMKFEFRKFDGECQITVIKHSQEKIGGTVITSRTGKLLHRVYRPEECRSRV